MGDIPYPANISLWDPTVTPMSYRDRITVEFVLNGTSYFLNFLLVVFLAKRKNLWSSLSSTIVFVSVGSLVQNMPLLGFQAWMVGHLQLGVEPRYSVVTCSFLKNFCSSTTSSYQVLPFAVSLYRYRTVVLKVKSTPVFVTTVHALVTSLLVSYVFLNFALGDNIVNDVCKVLRFSKPMEAVRIGTTLGINLVSIGMNLMILHFVKTFEERHRSLEKTSQKENTQSRRVQLTRSLLLQSVVPVAVSLPLLIGSLDFFFGVPIPSSIGGMWYATTFLGPFLMPLSSILSLPSTRRELVLFATCHIGAQKRTTITVVGGAPTRTFTRDDD